MVIRTERQRLGQLAAETARMSYPGAMSRGKRPVVSAGTKKRLEAYFVRVFTVESFWNGVEECFDTWHYARSQAIGHAIREHVNQGRNSRVVAAKFLDTFLHQLMKYEAWRTHWVDLHLPIDSKVITRLRQLKHPSLDGVKFHFSSSPYDLRYSQYMEIQDALWHFMDDLNARPDSEITFKSRIELNWLWL